VVRASNCHCQSRKSLEFNLSIPRLSGILRAADEAVLNKTLNMSTCADMERAQLSFANKVPPKKKRKSRTAFTNHQVTFTHREITKITDKKFKTKVRASLPPLGIRPQVIII
jgi:hypothetical protein